MRDQPKTTCDQCGADLSTTAYAAEYRAVITAEAMPGWGGVVYATAKRPPVDDDQHYCDMVCLAAWVAAKHPNAAADYERKLARRAALKETA